MKVSPQLFLFPPVRGKEVTAGFDGGDITSDTGALLVARADDRLGLTRSMSDQIVDARQSSKVRHTVATLLRQRVVAIACGYEDANDFGSLASDPAIKLACGRSPKTGPDLGSQPTISRFENRVNKKDVAAMGYAIARRVVAELPAKSRQLVIDIDAYEDPCHGQQEFEFFNGYYNSHCYVPLAVYVTGADGVQRLLGAILRSGKGGSAGVAGAIEVAVAAVRERFPSARIICVPIRGSATRMCYGCAISSISPTCLGWPATIGCRLYPRERRCGRAGCIHSVRQEERRVRLAGCSRTSTTRRDAGSGHGG